MNKKARYGLPSSSTVERNLRKNNARAFNDLGFEVPEIAQILGFSSNTIGNYLRETRGIHFSDTFDFAFKSWVFQNFTLEEQSILTKIKEAKEEAKHLSKESRRTHKIANGKGILGWIHKKILKDNKEYEKKNKDVSKKIKDLMKSAKILLKEYKNPRKYPHLHKSLLNLSIKITKTE